MARSLDVQLVTVPTQVSGTVESVDTRHYDGHCHSKEVLHSTFRPTPQASIQRQLLVFLHTRCRETRLPRLIQCEWLRDHTFRPSSTTQSLELKLGFGLKLLSGWQTTCPFIFVKWFVLFGTSAIPCRRLQVGSLMSLDTWMILDASHIFPLWQNLLLLLRSRVVIPSFISEE